jgi:hypothetical protein
MKTKLGTMLILCLMMVGLAVAQNASNSTGTNAANVNTPTALPGSGLNGLNQNFNDFGNNGLNQNFNSLNAPNPGTTTANPANPFANANSLISGSGTSTNPFINQTGNPFVNQTGITNPLANPFNTGMIVAPSSTSTKTQLTNTNVPSSAIDNFPLATNTRLPAIPPAASSTGVHFPTLTLGSTTRSSGAGMNGGRIGSTNAIANARRLGIVQQADGTFTNAQK